MGFEIEVVLGDLDDPAFFDNTENPMDVADPAFCRAVAALLRDETGMPWRTLRKPPVRPGFYVIPEYDLDPLFWPCGRAAGVELLTPPLPLAEAETARRTLAAAIEAIDGEFNFLHSDVTDGCACHINIDAGEDSLRADHFCMAVDELPQLARARRLFSKYASPQTHAYGPPLLRHLDTSGGDMLGGVELSNFLLAHAGYGKRYAANFEKLVRGYVELRHFSAVDFLTGPDLGVLLSPAIKAFEMWAVECSPFEDALLRRFDALLKWLKPIQSFFAFDLKSSTYVSGWHGEATFDGEAIGHAAFNGTFELNLSGRRSGNSIGAIWDIEWPDSIYGAAVCAMNYAQMIAAGFKVDKSPSRKFQRHLNVLAKRFSSDSALWLPAHDTSGRQGFNVGI